MRIALTALACVVAFAALLAAMVWAVIHCGFNPC